MSAVLVFVSVFVLLASSKCDSLQAGSDSLLTCSTFFKLRHVYFDDKIDDTKYLGVLYGLGVGSAAAAGPGTVTSN